MSAKEITLGILFFGVLIALGFVTLLLKDFPGLKKTHEYIIYFDKANELKAEDNALIMGTRQGKVVSVDFLDEPHWCDEFSCELWVKVMVRMEIPLLLKEDYKIKIRNANLLGGRVMDIRLGAKKRIIDPSVRLVGLSVPDPVEAISDFIATNRGPVKRTVENIDNLVQNVTDWSNWISEGKGTIGRLVKEESMANDFQGILADVKNMSSNLNRDDNLLSLLLRDPPTREKFSEIVDNFRSVSEKISLGEGTLGKIMANDDLYNKMLNIAEDVEVVSGRLNEGRGFLGKIMVEESEGTFHDFSGVMASLREMTQGEGMLNALFTDKELTGKFSTAMDRFDEITSTIQGIVQDVKEGRGVAGLLLQDENLAQELRKLIEQITGSVEDAREAAPLVSLGSFLFGVL